MIGIMWLLCYWKCRPTAQSPLRVPLLSLQWDSVNSCGLHGRHHKHNTTLRLKKEFWQAHFCHLLNDWEYWPTSFTISLHSCHGNDSSRGEFRDNGACWRTGGVAWGRDADVVINQCVASRLSAPFTVDVTLTGAGGLAPPLLHEPVIFNPSRGVSPGPAGAGVPLDGRLITLPVGLVCRSRPLLHMKQIIMLMTEMTQTRLEFDKTFQKAAACIILRPTELKL